MLSNLRKSTNATRYQGSSKLTSFYPKEVKTRAVEDVNNGLSLRATAEKHGIKNHRTIAKWCDAVREGRTWNDYHGRPSELSASDLASLADEINAGSGENYSMVLSEAKDLIVNKVIQNRKNRHPNQMEHSGPSETTINAIFDKMEVKKVVPDATTTARGLAEANINNSIGLCAGILAVCDYIDPRLIFNCDASQYFYDSKTEKHVYCGEYKEVLKLRDNIKADPEKNDANELGFGIKYYCTISSGGVMGDPIYIVADANMPENVVDPRVMTNFGLGVGVAPSSYLVFMKTRVPRSEFYRWYITSYFIPLVNKVRKAYGSNSYAMLQLDGEIDQIGIYDDAALQQLLHENLICVSKSSAGRTALEQPCDVGNVFRGSKATFRKSKYSEKKYAIEASFDTMFKEIWKEHHKLYSKQKVNYGHMNKALKGIYLVNRCLNRVLNRDVILQSFEKCGIMDRITQRPDAYTMLKKCRTPVTDETIEATVRLLPQLKKKILSQRILYDDVDFKDIPGSGNKASRDHLKAKYRKGYMFLTDPALFVNHNRNATISSEVLHQSEELPELELVVSQQVSEVVVVEPVSEVALVAPSRPRKRKVIFDA